MDEKTHFYSRYAGLLKGLNLVQQKGWQESELRHYFPDLKHHWEPFLLARAPQQNVTAEKWHELEQLHDALEKWDEPIEAGLLKRRLTKITQYFHEVEKDVCDAESLKFFLQDLPLITVSECRLPPRVPSTEPRLSAQEAGRLIDLELQRLFPQHSVHTILSASTLARASTTKSGIRLRLDATFTREEVDMLTVHEAWVHLGTNLAGTLQSKLPWLAHWHPGVTGFQEGLALIAEIITGHWHPIREAQVLLRHEAAHQALRGENARQVWQFICQHGIDSVSALEMTLRVFRGCSLAGGMAFGKEFQYLIGLQQWLVRQPFITGHDMQIALSGKMDFLEWEILRGTALGQQLVHVSSPKKLLTWMEEHPWDTLQKRLDFKQAS